jgi:NAD(P)-dependent dehydrogenase (short-subunit alcohol dehydrogenase family)
MGWKDAYFREVSRMADRIQDGAGARSRGAAVALTVAGLLAARALLRARRAYPLRGKVVLITGGGRGLGLTLAREFARYGARLVICARDPDELERARRDLEERGADVLAISCDVTNLDQVREMERTVRERWGRVDVLVNNAGIIQVGPLETITREDYEEAMRVHFWGPLNTIETFVPAMRERRHGRVVNISSVGGKISVPHLLPYCASKFALTGLSQGLRAELERDNVLVTTVCPGLMRTGSPRNAYFKGKHRAEYAWFSISDSMPVLSTSAEHAARSIVEGCRHGDAEVVFPFLTQVAVRFHGLFPGATAEVLSLVNRALPAANGAGTRKLRGAESESAASPSLLTVLGDRAAEAHNQVR